MTRQSTKSCIFSGLAVSALVALGFSPALPPAAAQEGRPVLDSDGTVHAALAAPLSNFLSPEAKAALNKRLHVPPGPSAAKEGVEASRAFSDTLAKESLDGWLKIYPSKMEDTKINGVHVFVVTPEAGVDPANKNRVLINAHMGGFLTGSRYGGLEEAVPLAGRGKIKVIAVDYRLSPENIFPAASEDMEAVYREVLKSTRPENVGIYGCSAGGSLVAESMAWFQKHNLPRPGAISIQCSGAMKTLWFGGDEGAVAPLLNATAASGPPPAVPPPGMPRNYFTGVDLSDPLVAPAEHPEVLAKFPPTLMVTGTRDLTMSNVIVTHAALLKAGVEAQLFVQEGLGHGHFFAFPGTPESALAYDVMWKFFDTHLKR